MAVFPRTFWRWATALWIGVVLFSSTSTAAYWCETAYNNVSRFLFGAVDQKPGFDILHLLADKGFHVMLFFVFAVLLWNSVAAVSGKPWKVILAGAFLGSCSEYLQSFFPDRDPAIRDVCINTAGTALGVGAVLLAARFGSRQARQPVAVSSKP
jgi:VanZ family protein